MDLARLAGSYYEWLEAFTAAIAAIIFVSSVDDLFIDLWYWCRRLYRWLFVLRSSAYAPLRPEQLHNKPQQPIAIMVPAWHEHDVIASMLQNMIEVLDYDDYMVFVGTYANDAATGKEVDRMCRRYSHVRRVEVPHAGPTCKADCLNFVARAVLAHEAVSGKQFGAVVLHDAEDVLHPLELKFFNYLVPRKDMVQLPVISLPRRGAELVAGTYMDEFAEIQKEMAVRESMTGAVPSAGVGTCLSRRALAALVGTQDNDPFSTTTLTEDYDIGMRLAPLGMKCIFGVYPVTYTVRESTTDRTGRSAGRSVRLPLSVREYFPDSFRTAYRQKARWILGIGLQSWAQIPLRGRSAAGKYMLLHDRKGVVTAFVSLLAYVLVLQYIMFYAGVWFGWWTVSSPSLFEGNSGWLVLMQVNAGFLLSRLVQRFYFTARIYGWRQGIFSVPRLVVGNFVHGMAVCRAWRLFFGHVFMRRRLTWDKTAHEFPTADTLVRRRKRLGELLQAWHAVDESALSLALQQQATNGLPLGRVLLANRAVDEETLTEALAYQADLPRGRLSLATLRANADRIPADLAQLLRIVPLETKGMALVVGVASPLSAEAMAQLRLRLGKEPLQYILSETEVDLALKVLHERKGSGARLPAAAIKAATESVK